MQELLHLKPRKRFRYAFSEFEDRLEALGDEVQRARAVDPAEASVYDRKLIELDNRIRAYQRLKYAFTPINFPSVPTQAEYEADPEAAQQVLLEIKRRIDSTTAFQHELERMQPPLAVPHESEGDVTWSAYSVAYNSAFVGRVFGEEPNPATISWNKILHAHAIDDTGEFDTAVSSYEDWLSKNLPDDGADRAKTTFVPSKTRFEAFFNRCRPFIHASVLYVVAFVLGTLGWLAFPSVFRRSAMTVLTVAFIVHTLALIGRVYVSGRPPVTNLYSSAIFIGWGGVALGMVLEAIYRIGIGGVLGAVSGFATLRIAHALAADGDTFTVLTAVLDTQFWLSTHVTCITFGYTTMLVAGLLGSAYVIAPILSLGA